LRSTWTILWMKVCWLPAQPQTKVREYCSRVVDLTQQ
jgi:hypothetical protein